jgi:hypothetical protein
MLAGLAVAVNAFDLHDRSLAQAALLNNGGDWTFSTQTIGGPI